MHLEKLTAELEKICLSTGDFILSERNKVGTGDIEHKSLNSLVSYVDKTAEEQLVDGLKVLLPEAGFIAEEGTETLKGDQFNWIIDPLDGTTNFLHGIPVFAISVALMKDNEIVAGVVYELGQKELFKAWKGGGAYMNEQRIKVSSNTQMSESLLATGFPYYDFKRMPQFLELLSVLFENSRGVRRLGSAATDLAYVACGRFDGFFEYGLNAWDVAAGVLLVTEAGGRVADYKGGDNYIFGSEIIASSTGIYAHFLSLINTHMDS